jgi:hypothetical protein
MVCGRLGFEVKVARLYPERGGVEAMLVPQPAGRFRIVVDPTPKRGWGGLSQNLRVAVARHRIRFRIAHELAHTLFYRGVGSGSEPGRIEQVGTLAEELFADRFAAALLVSLCRPSMKATDVVASHRQYDVSLEVAARAYAAEDAADTVTLWHWTAKHASPSVQWSNGSRLQRGRPASLDALLQTVKVRPGASVAVLPTRRQALVMGC